MGTHPLVYIEIFFGAGFISCLCVVFLDLTDQSHGNISKNK